VRPRFVLLLLPALAAVAFGPLVLAEDWPRFRGPNGSGVSEATGLPTAFGRASNLAWRVEVPAGRSSPIVVGNRVYVTALERDALVTLALDRQTGATVFRKEIRRERAHKVYVGNDTATPTPASDGENVYAFFPDLGLVSFDATGGERWRLRLGPFKSFYGLASSPVVHGDALFLVCDQGHGAFVLAVEKDTGRERWRVARPQATTEGYSTPVVHAPRHGRAQLVVTGTHRVDAYDAATGAVAWSAGQQGIYPIASPVLLAGQSVITVSQGGDSPPYPPFDDFLKRLDKSGDQRLSAEELDGDAEYKDHFGWADIDGDSFIEREEWDARQKEGITDEGVTGIRIPAAAGPADAVVLWRYKKSYSGMVTPLLYRGVLYLLKNGGILTTLDPTTGAVLKSGRLTGAIDTYHASPAAADGKVYLVSHSGKVVVLTAGAEWQIAAVNELDETAEASPAIADGRLYVRTSKALWSFGARR
jgi:outer membrane protein assembly factor BamB